MLMNYLLSAEDGVWWTTNTILAMGIDELLAIYSRWDIDELLAISSRWGIDELLYLLSAVRWVLINYSLSTVDVILMYYLLSEVGLDEVLINYFAICSRCDIDGTISLSCYQQ